MIGILQRYISRELFKTFALTAIGLTLVFSLCGGVLNMLEAEMLSSVQLLRMLGLVLPVATTLTLPVAALFASAMVYGRLAMDNEFDACKASGINIYRLLAPALVLSIVTAVCTFTLSNYFIPHIIKNLDEIVRKDIHKLVISTLKTHGHIRRGPYVLYAGNIQQNEAGGNANELQISNAAFMQFEGENLTRCGTADSLLIDFMARSSTGDPVIQAEMFNVHALDILRLHFYQLESQPFDPIQISSKITMKPKWLDLRELLYYRHRPTELPDIKADMLELRARIRDAMFYRNAYEQIMGPSHRLEIADEDRQYVITAERLKPREEDLQLTLYNVKIDTTAGSQRRHYEAGRLAIRIKSGFGDTGDRVVLILEDGVQWTDASEPDKVIPRTRVQLPAVRFPLEIAEAAATASVADLLGDDWSSEEELPEMGLGHNVQDARMFGRGNLAEVQREIVGIIHSRLAFSASVLVMLILAAALGIILRGGQLLTAFVISFVPGLFVVVMNIMGRQLSENSVTHLLGLMIIWGAIAVVAAADVWVLTKQLRR